MILLLRILEKGTDTIFAEVSYTASDNVENLYLYGSSNINATGNTLDNNLWATGK